MREGVLLLLWQFSKASTLNYNILYKHQNYLQNQIVEMVTEPTLLVSSIFFWTYKHQPPKLSLFEIKIIHSVPIRFCNDEQLTRNSMKDKHFHNKI